MTDNANYSSAYKTLSKICLVIVSAIIVFAMLVERISLEYAPFNGFMPDFSYTNVLKYILLAISILEIVSIGPLKKYLMSDKFVSFFDRRTFRSPNTSYRNYGQFMSVSLLAIGLCEWIGLFGMLIFLINGNRQDFYVFFVISLIGSAIYFPRYSQMMKWINKRAEISN